MMPSPAWLVAAWLPLSLWFAVSDARARNAARLAPPWRRLPRWSPAVAASALLITAVAARHGAATSAVIVCAWMTFGLAFTAAINAWPRATWRLCAWLAWTSPVAWLAAWSVAR